MLGELLNRHRSLIVIIVLFLVLATTYSVVTPIFEASDELWHYPMVKYIADHWSLPVQDPQNVGPWRQEGSQPPLYYIIGALATAWIDTSDMAEVRWLNPHVDNGIITEDGNTNLVIHSSREAFPWRGTVLAVHVIRLLSVLMGAGTVLLTYLTAKELLPHREEVALGAAAITAFNPMFCFISGSVNNDNLTMTLCAAALFQLLRLVKVQIPNLQPPTSNFQPPTSNLQSQTLLGIVLGLAVLTKESALGLLPLTALAISYVAWRWRSWRVFLVGGIITAGLVILIAGWWYWRNQVLYGDWLGLETFIAILGKRAAPATLRQLWGERVGFMMAYWGLFGGVNVPLPGWVYTVLNGVVVLAAAGLLLRLLRLILYYLRARNLQPATCNLQPATCNLQPATCYLLLLAWPAVVVISWSRWATVTWSSQGRLVFSAISAWSVLTALGLAAWLPQRWTRVLLALVGAFMLVVATAAPFAVIAPAYAAPPPLSENQLATISHRLDVDFGGKMRLLGYDLETNEVRPGESLRFTLYWQCLDTMDRDWSVFLHLLDENELIVAQRDRYPGQGLLATRLLTPGRTFADRYVLPIPATAYAPSDTTLEIGLFDVRTNERLPITSASGESLGDHLRFEKIRILPWPGEVPNPVSFNFGDKMKLIGYHLDRRIVAPGETLHLTLYWECLAEMDEDYTVFTHVLGEQDSIWAQMDSAPQRGAAPTSGWRVGQVIEDNYDLTVYPDTPPAVYDIEIGVYLPRPPDYPRLRVISPDGRVVDNRVLLGKVRVVAQ
ncbi:MAG: glycosyltransferase family 39 protein [Anaerolineae bacterium]|jgi:4-amino-4-deoxy-L-arabinose transferase-like glycosyltransferase|nr:glycosyltransferase family 39 protein [Anaerolineae bacterium]MDH7474138.1 glycosyltransferase family 39 protein [Anaerolineae bacterium]